MKMRLPFSIFLLTVSLLLHHLSIAQEIQLSRVEPPANGPVYQTLGMTQDNEGYLWLATTNGLYRYDGHQYSLYRHESLNSNSPAACQIERVAADRDGYIWSAPYCAGLDRLDPSTGNFTHFRHNDNDPASLASDSVWAILQDKDGTIWIGTNSGLDKLDTKTKKFVHYRHDINDPSSISSNGIAVLYEDKHGTLWVGTGNPFLSGSENQGGLNKLDKRTGKFTRYRHDEKDSHSLISNHVRAIFEDSHGNFWIGTAGDGLHTMDRTKGTFERHRYDPLHPGNLSRPPLKDIYPYAADHITFIMEDTKGCILIGTLEGGMNVYNPATQALSHYGTESMTNAQFWAAYKTRDNILWISTWENGLYKINPYQKILPYTHRGNEVRHFAEDDMQTLWMTTMGALIHIKNDGKEEKFLIDKDPSSLSNNFYYIEKDGRKFWITTSGGLYLFDPATKVFTHYTRSAGKANGLISDTVSTLKKGVGDILWICTDKGLEQMNTKTGNVRHFQHDPSDSGSVSSNLIITLNMDKKNTLWACADKGLNRLDEKTGRFKRYLTQSPVVHMVEDRQGDLWATTDAGLFRYNKEADEFFSFTDEASVINSDLVIWIMEDLQENLWLNTERGIIRLDKERKVAVLYGKNQGVNSSVRISAGYVRQNGDVLFGDSSGYFQIRNDLSSKNVHVPDVVISNFRLDNTPVQPSLDGILSQPLTQTKEIRLTYHQNNPSFQFTNVDFNSAPEDTRLLYKLHNYDHAWRRSGEEGTAVYFNLPPGKYTFSVKALNEAGLAAERSIDVIITPPWWRTWWAYSLGTLMILSIVYGLYRIRSDQVKREQAAQIHTMVAAQEGERKRIARDLHDDVGTKLSAVKLLLSSLREKASRSNDEEIKALAESSELFISEVMQDVRQLLMNLSPAVLEEFGYSTAVEGLINRINQTKQIRFNLAMFGMTSPLQKNDELALYRITQELINNVLKHAAAKNVSLQIGQRDDKIILMIEDDGNGFDVNAHKKGYGLQNLNARTKLMGGTMMIDSQRGRGTSVLIEIPNYSNEG